jgi:hypothetical protein
MPALESLLRRCELVHLDLSGCSLREDTPFDCLKQSLKHLNLSHNKIGSSGALKLGMVLAGRLRNLEYLDCSHNGIDVGILSLARAVQKCSTLHTLRLGGNAMKKHDKALLTTILTGNLSLEFIDLDDADETLDLAVRQNKLFSEGLKDPFQVVNSSFSNRKWLRIPNDVWSWKVEQQRQKHVCVFLMIVYLEHEELEPER